jgi:hypothetical protein
MASVVATKRYVYPPNWDETYEDWESGHKRYRVILTGVADGTADETNVHKIDLSQFKTTNGEPATQFRIDSIECISNVGFTLTTVSFDRDPVEILAAFGDYTNMRVDFTENGKYGGYVDGGTGGTGDIMISTTAGSVNDSYTIVIEFRPKP